MESGTFQKACKWQNPATKAYMPGSLTLDENKVQWRSAAGNHEISVLLPAITNQQRAKGKPFLRLLTAAKPYVFEFESELDRDSMVEHVSKAQAAQQEASNAGVASTGLSLNDRQRLLVEDKDLSELYTQMVAGNNGQAGVLTEEEFWQGITARRGSSAVSAAAPSASASVGASVGGPRRTQRTGLGNAMVVVEGEVDGRQSMGKGKLSVTVTPQMIVQIFAERPHVKRAFVKNVPSNMSEQEFWNRFVKHEVAKEVRRKRMLSGNSVEDVPDDFSEFFSSAASSVEEHRRQRGKALCVNPAINLTSHFDGNPTMQGHGLAHETGREADAVSVQGKATMKYAGDLVHDINRHAEVVLGGVDAMQELAARKPKTGADKGKGEAAGIKLNGQDERGSRNDQDCRMRLDDLVEEAKAVPEMLRIKDPRRYFDRMQGDGSVVVKPDIHIKSEVIKEEPGQESVGCVGAQGYVRHEFKSPGLQSLFQIDPHALNLQPMGHGDAIKVMYQCVDGSELSRAQAHGQGPVTSNISTATKSPADVLPPVLLSMIRTSVLAINELCRHFWACVPAPESAARKNKLVRLGTALNSKYEEVERMVSAAQGPERAYIRQLLRPPRDMLEAALVRYDNEKILLP